MVQVLNSEFVLVALQKLKNQSTQLFTHNWEGGSERRINAFIKTVRASDPSKDTGKVGSN